jgi:hypothetical protein
MELNASLDDFIAETPSKGSKYSNLLKKLQRKEGEFLRAIRGENIKFYWNKKRQRRALFTGHDMEVDRASWEALKYAREKVLAEIENDQVVEDLSREIGSRTCALPVIVRPDGDVVMQNPGDLKRLTKLSDEFPGAKHANISNKTSYTSKRVQTINLKDTFIPQIEKRYLDKNGQFKKNSEASYDRQMYILDSFQAFLIKHEISFFTLRKKTGNKMTTFVKFPLGWPKVAHTHYTISIIPTDRDFQKIGEVLFNEKKKRLWEATKLSGLFGGGSEILFDFLEAQEAARKANWPEPELLDGDLITLPSSSDYI